MKDILNYEGYYQISEDGKIWSVKSQKFLSPRKDKAGYLAVNLAKDGNVKMYKVHRLVALTYLEPPLSNEQNTIDHINHIRDDNRIENLRWATSKEQAENRIDKPKKVEMRDKNNHSILYKVFDNARQAAILEFNDVNKKGHIYKCLKGQLKSAYGYWWCYHE